MVFGPHLALCTLVLPFSETFLWDIAADFQIHLVPSPHPTPTGQFQKFEGEQLPCARNGAQPRTPHRSLALKAADDSGRCGLGPVHESPHVPFVMSPRQALSLSPLTTSLYKFRPKHYWLMMLVVALGFPLSFEGV